MSVGLKLTAPQSGQTKDGNTKGLPHRSHRILP
jgi:hypothetical protein